MNKIYTSLQNSKAKFAISGQITHIASKDINIGDYVNVLITEASPFALKSELI